MEPIVAVAAHNRPESTGKALHAHSNPSKDDILLFIFSFAGGYMGEGPKPPEPLRRQAVHKKGQRQGARRNRKQESADRQQRHPHGAQRCSGRPQTHNPPDLH